MSCDSDLKILEALQAKLAQQSITHGASGRGFRNSELATACSHLESRQHVQALSNLLAERGAFGLHAEVYDCVDGENVLPVTVLRASLTDTWPMGTHYWIRDNALVAYRLLHLKNGSEEESRLGKQLMLSGLTLISTSPQLKRFHKILSEGNKLAADPFEWPYIFFEIASNLNTAKDEPWMHIQDAWQMLAVRTIQSLQSGALTLEELLPAHLEFLSLVVPFLAVVDNAHCENAGSWEELVAVRSSVIAWELAFLKLLEGAEGDRIYTLLEQEYEKLSANYGLDKNFKDQIASLLERSEAVIAKNFPYESPGYEEEDPRYRRADSALIALLELDLVSSEQEEPLLAQILSLKDSRTRAQCRYRDDSYQGTGFFRPSTVAKLREYYGAPSGESSGAGDFVMRRKIVPEGPEAAWLHFLFQLSSWAGRRYIETGDEKYFEMQKENLLDGLSLVTGDNEYTLHADNDGHVEVIALAPYLFPECYITDMAPDGQQLVFPSPHTPLNWATAEARCAVDRMLESLKRD